MKFVRSHKRFAGLIVLFSALLAVGVTAGPSAAHTAAAKRPAHTTLAGPAGVSDEDDSSWGG
jgi:hypothetical protein